MNEFEQDFIGKKLHLVLIGYIRGEIFSVPADIDTYGERKTTTQARRVRYRGS